VWQGLWADCALLATQRFYWRAASGSSVLEAVDSLAAGCERQVIWLPFTVEDQDRGLPLRLAAEGLVPERLLHASEERQIRSTLPACLDLSVARWCGDAPAWA